MDDVVKTRLAAIAAPYGRDIWIDDVGFDSGMRLLRITVREGRRFTVLDIDADTARSWADVMTAWIAHPDATGPTQDNDSQH